LRTQSVSSEVPNHRPSLPTLSKGAIFSKK
jgi:hypothetical protein